MGNFKKILKLALNILSSFLIILLLLVLYGKVAMTFGKKAYPNYFGYTLFQVASGSMEPALYINDVIIVNIDSKDLKENDIITYQNGSDIITHRIIMIDGDKLTVKGDNNNTIDAPIDRSAVIGKVIKILPKIGVWKKVLTEPKILIFIFITLLLFDFALSYDGKNNDLEEKVKEKKEEVEEPEVVITPIKSDVLNAEDLLELTRKIDVKEINELLEKDLKLETHEVENLEKKLENIENTLKLPKLNTNEKKFLEYTVRLDLNEIQKKIKLNVK